jgi:hypothetical protein
MTAASHLPTSPSDEQAGVFVRNSTGLIREVSLFDSTTG